MFLVPSELSAIRSTRVITPAGEVPATILIHGEVIERVGGYAEPLDDIPAIDYGDLVIMPGVVDSHVHVNEPGRTEWEGFETATRAAAAGGVTTIVDMPLNCIPSTTTVEALHRKLEVMTGRLHVDVGLWGGVVRGNVGDLRPMVAEGVLGFKCFLVDSGVEEFPHVDEQGLRSALEVLGDCGVPLLVHAELPGPIDVASHTLKAKSPSAYLTYLESRPSAAEDEAIALVAHHTLDTGARAHIVHLGSAGALEIIRDACARGARLTAETTPHYLSFAAESIPDGATEFKCAPPIRDASNREGLWEGLRSGVISLVVSDHSPCTPDLKKKELRDFSAAWGGIASLQFGLPALWTGASARGFDRTDVARWMCAEPARLAGLETRKGRIVPGADADFVVWSPEKTFTVVTESIEHRHKMTPYAGMELRGVVVATWLRGVRLFEGGVHHDARRGVWLSGR